MDIDGTKINDYKGEKLSENAYNFLLKLNEIYNKFSENLESIDFESENYEIVELYLSFENENTLHPFSGLVKKYCPKIEKIELNLNFREIPNSIIDVPKLTFLDIRGDVSTFPNILSKLVDLKKLWLYYLKNLTIFPNEICEISNLEELHLRGCNFNNISNSIENLKNLKILDFTKLNITNLPETICNLKHLEKLSVWRSNLVSLPINFGKLTSLREIEFGYLHHFETLPKVMCNLPNLEILQISMSPLRIIPDSIGNLKNLKELNLFGTLIEQLPQRLFILTKLEILNLNGTKLNGIPFIIANLKNLYELHILNTSVNSLPESMILLSNLKKIYFDRDKIQLPANLLFHPLYSSITKELVKKSTINQLIELREQNEDLKELIDSYLKEIFQELF